MTRPRLNPYHIDCERCGYDLYHIDRGGACPECGLRVAETFYAYEQKRARRARTPAEVHRITLWVLALLLCVNVALLFCVGPMDPAFVALISAGGWVIVGVLLVVEAIVLRVIIAANPHLGEHGPAKAFLLLVYAFVSFGLALIAYVMMLTFAHLWW